MSFRIGKDSTLLANGFCAALREELARAIDELDLSSRPSAAAIHDARKRMKKARSLLRLFKAASFPDVSPADNALLRDAGAQLAVARNAEANLRALKKLCRDSGADPLRFPKVFALLEQQKKAASGGARAAMHRAATMLKGELSKIESWHDALVAWKDVERGLKLFYKRGRNAFRKTQKDPTAENLHRWRKRAKDILYGAKLIRSVSPKMARRLMRPAKKMSLLLGSDHDLALLQDLVDQSGSRREKAALAKLTRVRRRKLQCKARQLGKKYFALKPKTFSKKVAKQV